MTTTPNQSALILDRSNKALQATVATLNKATAEFTALASKSEELTNQIEDKQAQLAELANRNAVCLREANADLALRIKEDRAKVLAELLKESGLANISVNELVALQKQLQELQNKDDAELKAAVAAAVQNNQRNAEAAAAQKDAEHRVANAEKDAKIASMTEKVAFMSEQVKQLQSQIDAERVTRLDIAKADAQRQSVVVQTGKQ